MFLVMAGIGILCGIWVLCEFSDSYKPKSKKKKSAQQRTKELYGDYIYTKEGREALRIARKYDQQKERDRTKQQFHAVRTKSNSQLFLTVGEDSREQVQRISCKNNRYAV